MFIIVELCYERDFCAYLGSCLFFRYADISMFISMCIFLGGTIRDVLFTSRCRSMCNSTGSFMLLSRYLYAGLTVFLCVLTAIKQCVECFFLGLEVIRELNFLGFQ